MENIFNFIKIDWSALVFGIQAVLAGILTVSLKSYASSLLDLQKFKASIHLGIGTYIRMSSTHTGYDDGEIIYVNRKYIIIRFKDYKLLKSIKGFDQQDWAILNDKPKWMTNEHRSS